MNILIVCGRLGKDPVLKELGPNQVVVEFPIATDHNFKKKDGTKVKKTTWHNINAWNELGRNCHDVLRKGMKVTVRGKQENEIFEYNGEKRSRSFVTAQYVEFPDIDKEIPRKDVNGNVKADPVFDTNDIPF